MSNTAVKESATPVTVPLLDLKAQYRTIEDEIKVAIEEVLSSQYFILGPKVVELEEQIAAYCQAGHGVGVSSGTDALLLALMALEVGAGDEVITTPYTFFATAGAISRVGARPIFVDIDPQSYNISPEAVATLLREQCEKRDGVLVNRETGGRVKAMIPVHLYGQVADMDPLMELAREHDIKVVEDAAQAIGSEYTQGRRAGSMGDIGCFSFFPSKNLGAFGDGGMCTTNDPALAERMRILRAHGSKPKYFHALIGGNFRLDALQAAVLLVKFKYLDDWTTARQANARRYDEMFARAGLGNRVSTPRLMDGYRHIYNQYVLRVEKRDELRKALNESNIGSEIYYPVSLHSQECFSYLGYQPNDCTESTEAADNTLAVPVYPELNVEQQEHVVATIANFYS